MGGDGGAGRSWLSPPGRPPPAHSCLDRNAAPPCRRRGPWPGAGAVVQVLPAPSLGCACQPTPPPARRGEEAAGRRLGWRCGARGRRLCTGWPCGREGLRRRPGSSSRGGGPRREVSERRPPYTPAGFLTPTPRKPDSRGGRVSERQTGDGHRGLPGCTRPPGLHAGSAFAHPGARPAPTRGPGAGGAHLGERSAPWRWPRGPRGPRGPRPRGPGGPTPAGCVPACQSS